MQSAPRVVTRFGEDRNPREIGHDAQPELRWRTSKRFSRIDSQRRETRCYTEA